MRLQFIEPERSWRKMLPITYTRPLADVRVGILKIQEKWSQRLGAFNYGFETEDYLQDLFPALDSYELAINSSILPSDTLIKSVKKLKQNEFLQQDGLFIAGKKEGKAINFEGVLNQIRFPWDIFSQTCQEIEADFELLTEGRKSQTIDDPHTIVYGHRIFLEEGARVRASVLNAESGPIYLGKNSQIHEGSLIQGSFALGEGSHVNMGSKVKGDSSVGPWSKIGGEVSNSSIQGYSNKSHDGFLGNSVLGEWCNIGADTNSSNLKNNYSNIKMWDFESKKFADTELKFCGLIMGDHSKSGINTMFNTGTTVGVSVNIFGSGFPRTIIPSFSWGGANGFSTYAIQKAVETAKIVMSRRMRELSHKEQRVLEKVFEMTHSERG